MDVSRNTFQLAFAIVLLLVSACSQQRKDQEIKADITIKAKEDINFAGVRFLVDSGVVTLMGTFPTVKSRAMAIQKLKTIHIIKRIDDQVRIGQVALGENLTRQQDLDSIMSKYPGISSIVSDTSVALIGKISTSDLQKILPGIKQVHPNVSTRLLTTNL